jgi:hypothetical protein
MPSFLTTFFPMRPNSKLLPGWVATNFLDSGRLPQGLKGERPVVADRPFVAFVVIYITTWGVEGSRLRRCQPPPVSITLQVRAVSKAYRPGGTQNRTCRKAATCGHQKNGLELPPRVAPARIVLPSSGEGNMATVCSIRKTGKPAAHVVRVLEHSGQQNERADRAMVSGTGIDRTAANAPKFHCHHGRNPQSAAFIAGHKSRHIAT